MGTNQRIGGGGFHHLALKAYDFDASVVFYTELLGFQERVRWGEGDSRAIMLDTGDGNYLELFAGGKKETEPGLYFHVAYRSEEVDAVTERVRSAGYEVTVEPKDVMLKDIPVRISFFKGPDGEVIELFQSTGENKL